MNEALIFDMSSPGRIAYSLPALDVPEIKMSELVPEHLQRKEVPQLPEVSEPEVIRHYTALSHLNYGVDNGFYPLGSCTMKYNPKVNEVAARMPGFSRIHPLQPAKSVQGALALLQSLSEMLAEITGMDAFSLQPAAGAQGEWSGLLTIKKYLGKKGETGRIRVIVPDTAHGTNPASARMAGFQVVTVRSNEKGLLDIEALANVLGKDTAALMLTNPNTLGLFEEEIETIARMVHEAGGLLYYDGANANAILGVSRPGDMGFDVVHLNLHKTFSTPHGGGGPGAGPIGVKEELSPFLPVPVIRREGGQVILDEACPESIGKVKAFYGNFGVLVRAYAYIRTMGPEGLRQVSENAVLNANYLMRRLEPYFELPYPQNCKHEFVLSGAKQKKKGVKTVDMAKRMIDFGLHPPTVYFPQVVDEALMIEPTETESKVTLDHFIEIMMQIAKEAESTPEKLKQAPHTSTYKRLDEVTAARHPVLRYMKKK